MAGGPYKRTNGWQVKWQQSVDGKLAWQSETLAEKLDADEFKVKVERAGNRWPVDEHGQKWIKGEGFPEWVEPERGTPFLDYALKRIRTLYQAERIGPEQARKYRGYAHAIAGSMAVAPLLLESVQADDDLNLHSARNPELARPLLHQLVGKLTDEQIADRAKKVCLEDFDADTIRAFILWQRVRAKRTDGTGPGRAWKTIRNYHSFLHGVLEQAYYEDLISKNPCKVTSQELGRGVVVEKITLTPDEFWLIHSCMDTRFQEFIEGAVGSGARFGELTASRVCDWDSLARCLHVEEAWKRGLPGEGFYRGEPKSDAGKRDIYVGVRVAEIFDAAVEGKGDEDLLFTAAKGGRIRQSVFYEDYWQPAVRRAVEQGLTRKGKPIYPRFHDLRHTYISWLREGGLANELIKGMVGHTDAAMTEQYGEIPIAVKQQAAAAIDAGLRRLRAV